jgi:hypothetical protein
MLQERKKNMFARRCNSESRSAEDEESGLYDDLMKNNSSRNVP